MAEVPHAKSIEEPSVDLGGYRQELKRTLGSFQVFAISFAFISVAVGVFGTYDQVLRTAGPVGIWLWVIAAVGQTLVALVTAQFAARIVAIINASAVVVEVVIVGVLVIARRSRW